MGPLDGVRIIDITSVVMGPFATQMMGDFGADVIKIEAPEGDVARKITAGRNAGMGPMFLNSNRSKRSITLDLKQKSGKDALLRLCETADILVCNVRAKAMQRLGLSYEDVSAVNPRLIYAGLVGYGEDGPYAGRPAYDDLIQGGATMAHLYARATGNEPHYVPSAIADRAVAMYAVGVIVSTLVERNRTGQGQYVSIPMFETMVNMTMADHMGGLTFDPPLDSGGYSRQLSPSRRPYRTSDGYVCVPILTDTHFDRFFTAIDRQDIPQNDPRFRDLESRIAHIDEVYAWLSKAFLERTTAEWMDLLEKADLPAMPMHDFESVLQDPHLVATDFFRSVTHPTEGPIREMAVPATWSRSKTAVRYPAPQQGQHGPEILREAGFCEDEIAALVKDGVMGGSD